MINIPNNQCIRTELKTVTNLTRSTENVSSGIITSLRSLKEFGKEFQFIFQRRTETYIFSFFIESHSKCLEVFPMSSFITAPLKCRSARSTGVRQRPTAGVEVVYSVSGEKWRQAHRASNGAAERSVQILKRALMKRAGSRQPRVPCHSVSLRLSGVPRKGCF